MSELEPSISAEGDIIPLYEYSCQACGHRFEALVLRGDEPSACPACDSAEVERLLSRPAVKSDATHDLAMRAAKRRDKAQADERVSAQREYEESHDRHGH